MNAAELLGSAAAIIKPPPKRNAGAWADGVRVMPQGSPQPGPWRSDRTPYWWPVYDAAESPRYSTIVAVCGSQMGKTEAALNIMGKGFDDGPLVPTLYVGPKESWVRDMSEARFGPMIRQCAPLLEKLHKGQQDKLLSKYFAGVPLVLGTGGSASDLAGQPFGRAIVDERDRMDNDVGGEGDPVELVRGRLKNYVGAKLFIFSTPTLEGASPIWWHYLEGTMGKWQWPCPHCHEYYTLSLELLRWPDKATPTEAREKSAVYCPHCGAPTENKDKHDANREGRYQYHVQGDDGALVPVTETPVNSTASFWISGIASPWQSMGEIAELLCAAYRAMDENKLQGVVNVQGGEIFRMRGEAPPLEAVESLRAGYQRGQVPTGAQFLTLGMDVQKEGLYFLVVAWGYNAESWVIDWGYLFGETEFSNVWMQASGQVQKSYLGRTIARGLVDEGYRPGRKHRTPVNMVHEFCRRHDGLLLPAKGHDTLDRTLKPVKFEYAPSGAVNPYGMQRIHHNTDELKTWVHSRMKWPAGEPGAMHLPSDVDGDLMGQLVAEERVLKPSGKVTWIVRGPNHYFDCMVLARAAAIMCGVDQLPAPEDDAEPQPAQGETAHKLPREDDFIGAGDFWTI